MSFEFENSTPIYLQLVEILKRNIIAGVLKPGERLLSVRELALKMKVNPNTVQRALQDLESQQLIYTERTNGKFVTQDEKLIEECKREYAKSLTKKYCYNMQEIGMTKEEIIACLNEIRGEI